MVDYKKGGTFIYSDEGTCTDKQFSKLGTMISQQKVLPVIIHIEI